ncbi:MAG: type III restriction-modification system endonuclease [Alloprevotella sp.]
MKLKFKHQAFQRDAARAVTDVFLGQRKTDGFTYRRDAGKGFSSNFEEDYLGVRNEPLMVDNATLVENIRRVQIPQDIEPIDHIVGKEELRLTIEMETGTGKTYTYIKTMFELHKLYGWSKFIIVVPSIAIREGVVKSLDVMQDHFAEEYGKRLQYFVYNSSNLTPIDAFAMDNSLHVMVINTQAFNATGKDARRFKMKLEDFGYRRPIDVIAETNPILIIDEPQSVLGADKNNKTRAGLREFKPLFSILYSATHRKDDTYNQVFRLDAIDALNKKLVKKIEVMGIHQKGSTATNGYVYLERIIPGKKGAAPTARLGFDKKTVSGISQTMKAVAEGFDLFSNSGELKEYRDNYIVERIDGVNGSVRLLNGLTLNEGELVGSVNEDLLRRFQIRETIRAHFNREKALFSQGIKVLSLFFIDEVENYRIYEDGTTRNGKYAEMFEEEYRRVLKEMSTEFTDGAYVCYLNNIHVEETHQGYFSRDKKGHFVNSKVERGTQNSADVDAYDLIMRDKEALLSLDPKVKGSQVRFIFSHSALKEGWDNPNVFQICTLKNANSEIKKRQEVGRGMRLCVNQKGERQDAETLGAAVFDTNVLTVIASESYEDFANALQKEMAEAITSRPIIVTAHLFEGKTIERSGDKKETVTTDQARRIYNQLIRKDYVDDDGKLTQTYHDAKQNDTLDLGDFNDAKASIVGILDKVFNPESIKLGNGHNAREAKFNADKFYRKEFQKLWKKINTRTYYTVDFDTTDLVKTAIKEINDHLQVTTIRFEIGSGTLEHIRNKEELESGVAMTVGKVRTIVTTEAVASGVKYDLIGELVNKTGLTRQAVADILMGILPSKFNQYKVNPEEFIIKVGNIINETKALSVVEHIVYHKLDKTYDEDVFTEHTIRGKLGINALESTKSLYDLVVVDSVGTEKDFAQELEKHNEVLVYTKLPSGFYINTPMGHYNPDWAVVFQEGSVKHIYFVAETKGSMKTSELRGVEKKKIECAKKHFASISDSTVKYEVVENYGKLYDIVRT